MKKKLGENVINWFGGEDFYFALLTKEDWIKNNPDTAHKKQGRGGYEGGRGRMILGRIGKRAKASPRGVWHSRESR